ncbi:MAG: TonB-dependent siderophore receptor [Steroidobacteraceae bacterium]|nr:TonB-dependent siderophore receptor [Steroidobacteraceae bacterium]
MTRIRMAVALGLACSASSAWAEVDAVGVATLAQLPRVTVTGQRESDGYVSTHNRSAMKTDTPLRDVPQSVTVVTRELIRDQSMQSLADVARYVPGAGMAQGEGNRDTIILRGNSSTADFFVDGVRDDVEYFRDLYNVERVEALKGPNAMIFGRAGAGGVINRVTRQAQWNRIREATLEGGSWEHGRATLDLGDGVGDRLALRLTGVYENSESHRDGFMLERFGVNPTAALQLGENTTLRLSYEYFDYDRTADRGIPSLAGRPLDTDPSTFFGDPELSGTRATVNQAAVVIDHDFSDNVRLRNRTMYADYDKFYQNVFPGAVNAGAGTVAISAYNNVQLRENLFNQTDLEFAFETGSVGHRMLAGVELGEQVTDNFRETGYFNDSATTYQAPLSDPTISVPLTFRQSATDADNHGRASVAAVYVQDQIELSPRFQAVVGLRYDRFDVDFRNNRNGEVFRSRDDLLSPRAGLIYKPVEPVSVYASYSMTYMPRAGAQLTSLNLSNQALDPEEFENAEVGVKWDLREGLALTAAVFRLDRSNVVIADPNQPGESLLVDGQRTEGFELGVAGRIRENWSIQGGYAWQDGELTEALGGTRLAQLPRHVVSLWNKLDLTPAWGLGLGVIHQTRMYASADNAVTLPGFTRVDGAVYFAPTARLRLQLNLENLLDEEYFPNAHNNNNISTGAPRSVRIGLTASF